MLQTELSKNLLRRFSRLQTPFYIYDESRIRRNIDFLRNAFSDCDHEIFFAVKANTSICVLKIVKDRGIGAEVASPGEIFLSLKAGFKPDKILYNNIARKEEEVIYALEKGIVYFNCEAVDQASLLERCAKRLKKKIGMFVRVNPGIFPETHPHLSTGSPSSKFGVQEKELGEVATLAKRFRYAGVVGIHSHIGSQILSPSPFVEAAKNVIRMIEIFRRKGIGIEYVNLGGGFGIPYLPYENELNFNPIARIYREVARSHRVKVFLEPGRYIVGNAGCIVTKVISVKTRMNLPLYVVDAGMTENPRPAIYRAYHHIEPLLRKNGARRKARVVGPLCENSDEFGVYSLPDLKTNDYVLIYNCGAYTRTMASLYNGRPLAAEYCFDERSVRKVRSRQKLAGLIENEKY
jgi:diaminopimelate decarboxylase